MQLKKIFISVIAFGTVSAMGVSPVSADTVSEKNSQIEIKKIESNSLLKQISDAQNQVAKLNNQVSDKVVAINDAQSKIKDTNSQIDSLGKQIDVKKVEIDKRKDNLKDQVRSLQAASNNSVTGNTFLDFILGSSDLSDLIGRAFTVNKLNSASQGTLRSVQKATRELDDLKSQKSSKKEELVATKNQLESDRDQLVTLKEQAQSSSDSLSTQLEAHKDEISQLQSELSNAIAAASAEQEAKAKEAEQATASAANSSDAIAVNASYNGGSQGSSNNYAGVSVQSGSVGGVSNSNRPAATGVVGLAAQYLGVPYVWGGTTPAGFDCSGLVQYVFRQAGVSLPRTTYAQVNCGTAVPMSQIQPGDLLFWGSGSNCYHVAIYAGGGQYIHAPAPGQSVTYGSMAYFTPTCARRI
ncbi:NlpC/P60 family protein [Xylocopilactobacillus apicola]|uniref:NlpC/P60 domain-containing protein n=1 Tax=Xylocopilactobacillus apicola TaxID=2932184 RepID=A0AAU9DDE3_9LACO|nr:C40 family peptidase [Xylocopilactobacillus apicola]BDR59605.1 hypothetical protein XA3_20460 [Xylocopilactobacillus apicola]